MPSIIYALIDPRNAQEFYIGRTEDICKRFMQHLRGEGANDAKNARIRELKSLHILPIMKTLEVIQDIAVAAQREAYWIHHYRYLKVPLVNDVIYQYQQQEQEERQQIAQSPRRSGRMSAKAKAKLKVELTKNVYPLDEAAKLAKCSVGQIMRAVESGELVMAKSMNGVLKRSLESFILERSSKNKKKFSVVS